MRKASGRHKGRLGLAALAFTAGVGITSLAGGAWPARLPRAHPSPSS